jgi:hypothetical protein
MNFPASDAASPLGIHSFRRNLEHEGPDLRSDWFWVVFSSLKGVEFYVLYRFGGMLLPWLSCGPWIYFSLCAIVLLLQKSARGYQVGPKMAKVDILAGKLPTATNPGGARRILLGAPRNFRDNWLWKVCWSIGGFVCIASLLGSYVLLGRQELQVVYIWTAFQALGLMIRSVFFHLAPNADRYPVPLVEGKLRDSPLPARRRVLDLMFALAKYQAHAHPRQSYAYTEDLLSFERIDQLLCESDRRLCPAFPVHSIGDAERTVGLSIKGVIGDPVLNSASWFRGQNIMGMDLYDCCVLFLSIGDATVALPSVRVLATAHGNPNPDIESGQVPLKCPKGTSNMGPNTTQWCIWIPTSDGRWLYRATGPSLKQTGACKAEVLTDTEVSRRLGTGLLNISLQNSQDLRDVLQSSMRGAENLLELIAV